MSAHMVMISLVGEQPIPNILPIRHEEATEVVLAYTMSTKKVFQRLEKLLKPTVEVHPLEVLPYDISADILVLQKLIDEKKWNSSSLVFNLTGGTKIMSLAAYEVARNLSAQFLYFQSEGQESKIYKYVFKKREAVLCGDENIQESISLKEYLHAFLGEYVERGFSKTKGGDFERAVESFIRLAVDECLVGINRHALDIDLVCRISNQVAVVEIKSGERARQKEGIDQLNTAASREFLGTYTRKVLVIDTVWDHTRSNLRELAEAHNITLIELPSFHLQGKIDNKEKELAIATIQKILGRKGN